jgi:hypothetical protein
MWIPAVKLSTPAIKWYYKHIQREVWKSEVFVKSTVRFQYNTF